MKKAIKNVHQNQAKYMTIMLLRYVKANLH